MYNNVSDPQPCPNLRTSTHRAWPRWPCSVSTSLLSGSNKGAPNMAWSRLSWRLKRLWGFHGVHPGKCNVYEYIILFRRCLMLTVFQYLDFLLCLYGLNWKNIKSQLIQCFVIQGLGLVPTRSPAGRWGPLVRSLVSLPCTLDQ